VYSTLYGLQQFISRVLEGTRSLIAALYGPFASADASVDVYLQDLFI